MKPRKVVYPALGAIALILVVGTALDTQSQQLPLYKKVAPSEQTILKTAPTVLSSTQRIERYQEALKLANFPTITVPLISNMKVTPVAPRHSSGAEITAPISLSGVYSGVLTAYN
jgi:hypothetical protein